MNSKQKDPVRYGIAAIAGPIISLISSTLLNVYRDTLPYKFTLPIVKAIFFIFLPLLITVASFIAGIVMGILGIRSGDPKAKKLSIIGLVISGLIVVGLCTLALLFA
jgi:hypothetical protein